MLDHVSELKANGAGGEGWGGAEDDWPCWGEEGGRKENAAKEREGERKGEGEGGALDR